MDPDGVRSNRPRVAHWHSSLRQAREITQWIEAKRAVCMKLCFSGPVAVTPVILSECGEVSRRSAEPGEACEQRPGSRAE